MLTHSGAPHTLRAMVFSSPVFLFLFLPACLLAVAAATAIDRVVTARRSADGAAHHHPAANTVLLVFSLAFYAYGAGALSAVLLVSIAAGFMGGLVIDGTRYRKAGLVVAVGVQLALLGWFKYANFAVEQVNALRMAFGGTAAAWVPVLLPAGVSFFVFHGISYVVDVYRRQGKPFRNPADVALYLSLFPQLVAGPIVRFAHIAGQMRSRTLTAQDAGLGMTRFVYGLCKKVVVADPVGAVVDAVFGLPTASLTPAAALLGAVGYTLQIYFDFSAYSDMALGLARMLGFRFPENFERPLSAVSVTDFWRRWHISLSSWFRDYVYKPLGGSRGSAWRTGLNLWLVFLLSGLWHGATWTFVAWGAYHGAWLTFERRRRGQAAAPTGLSLALARARTFAIVVVGFTLFRASSFGQAAGFARALLAPSAWTAARAFPLDVELLLTHRNIILFVVALGSVLLPPTFVVGRTLESERTDAWVVAARIATMTLGLTVTSLLLASTNFSPFIYFRF